MSLECPFMHPPSVSQVPPVVPTPKPPADILAPTQPLNPNAPPEKASDGPSPSPEKSRTTKWRHQKARDEGKQYKRRKVLCPKCNERRLATNGHSQYKGHQYCPKDNELPLGVWLDIMRDKYGKDDKKN